MGLPYERVVRLHRHVDGERKPTRSVRVDFLCSLEDIPPVMVINYTQLRAMKFQRNPVRGYNCQRFGHTSATCKSKIKKVYQMHR